MPEQSVTRERDYTGASLAVGTAIGALIEIAMDSLSVGVGIGVAMGLSIGAGLEQRRKDREEKGAIK